MFLVRGNAQITTEILDPIIYEDYDLSGWDDIEIHILVKNTSSDTINLKWIFNRSNDICTEEWQTSYKDYNLCYSQNVTTNVNPDILLFNPVIMPPEFQYVQILVLDPNQLAGCCYFSFDFSDVENPNAILATIHLPIQINLDNCFTSTSELDVNDIIVYPNPFSDYIMLEYKEDVYSIEMYDLKGKLVHAQLVLGNAISHLNQLNSGIYLLILYNDQNEVLNTRKIVKE